ncbi:MAG: hypothetical protein ACK4X1_10240 [Terricaulis sp.]
MRGLQHIGPLLTRVAASLEPREQHEEAIAAGVDAAPREPFVLGVAWMPDLETEEQGYSLRLRGVRDLAAYRHSLAVARGEWLRSATARVLVRTNSVMLAFDCCFIGEGQQHLTSLFCCVACGCTEDRACVGDDGPCAWATRNPPTCTECVSKGETP